MDETVYEIESIEVDGDLLAVSEPYRALLERAMIR